MKFSRLLKTGTDLVDQNQRITMLEVGQTLFASVIDSSENETFDQNLNLSLQVTGRHSNGATLLILNILTSDGNFLNLSGTVNKCTLEI